MIDAVKTLDDFHRKSTNRLEDKERIAYQAIHSFPLPPRPETIEEHKFNLASFYCHHFNITFKSDLDPTKDVHESMYREPLEEAYGELWRSVTFRIARDGVEGGMIGLFRSLSFQLSKTQAQRGIGRMVDDLVESISEKDLQPLSREYLKRWKFLVPREGILRSWVDEEAGLNKLTLEKVLKNHPYWIREYERTAMKIGNNGMR